MMDSVTPEPKTDPHVERRGGSRHPITDIPTYAAKLAPNDYLESRSDELERKTSQLLNAVDESPETKPFMPQAVLPALEAVRSYGTQLLWSDVGKVNNLDKSVALDNLEALVDYASTQFDMISRGDYLSTSLDDRSKLAVELVASQLDENRTPQSWKAHDEKDTILNEFGQREAIRRNILLKKTLRKDPSEQKEAPLGLISFQQDSYATEVANAVREMDKYARSILSLVPKARVLPGPKYAEAKK